MKPSKSALKHTFGTLQEHGWEEGARRLREEMQQLGAAEAGPQRLLLAWLAIERGQAQQALDDLARLPASDEIGGWAEACHALLAIRSAEHAVADQRLDAAQRAVRGETSLATAVNHLRGVLLYRQNRFEEAIQLLARQFDEAVDEFWASRLLDSLGMVFVAKDNFYAARELFQRSLQLKQDCGDRGGEALTQGNLGRLYFDWGIFDRAEEHFQRDLQLSQAEADRVGEAVMHNWLGKVQIESGQASAAQEHLRRSVELGAELGISRLEAFARKDLAAALLMLDQLTEAQDQLGRADRLFAELSLDEGQAHCRAVEGVWHRQGGDYEASAGCLDEALQFFLRAQLWGEAARCQLEVARTRSAAGKDRAEVVAALKAALELAERCRRDFLIRRVESALHEADPGEHLRRVYQRVRGRHVDEDTVSLVDGRRESTSIMFLDLKGSTEYGRHTDPGVVMLEFNQLMAGFARVLEEHRATISGYRGDGFMALFRGRDRAARAVSAGLEMSRVLEDFNIPRRILGKPPYEIRVGISTGEVFNGNVGTYAKMDFTSIGTAANLAARLESQAEPPAPCICRATYESVHTLFEFKADNPRTVSAKGFEAATIQVWDVVERKAQ